MKKLDDVEAMEREKCYFECDVSDPDAEVHWFKFKSDKVCSTLWWPPLVGHNHCHLTLYDLDSRVVRELRSLFVVEHVGHTYMYM